MFEMLAKLLKALNSESNPIQISLAFSLGMIVGFTPFMSIHNLLVLLLACILRINFSGFILAVTVFAGIAYALDPLFIQIGESLLANESLQPFWTLLYQSDVWRVSHFNNTLTLGSLVVSLVLFIPGVFVFRVLIVKYREHILSWIKKLKLVQVFQGNKLYKAYQKISGGEV